jgi:D-alanyl-D-alanine carboxypeptidase (penicillin-binding protein 5/6)
MRRLWIFCVLCLLLTSCAQPVTDVLSESSYLSETVTGSAGESYVSDIELPPDIPPESRPEIEISDATSEGSPFDEDHLQVMSMELLQTGLQAKNAFVYDSALEGVFAKGDMDGRIYPASITKLYIIYVALQYLTPDTLITAGDELDLVRPGSSIAYIRKGHTLTAEMLVQGMMLPSGNDAAHVLVAAAGRAVLENPSATAREAVDAFMEAVNSHAAKDGLTGTHFVTPDGFHEDDHYTTMRDLLQIANLVSAQPIIMKYAGMHSAKVVYASGETNTWTNTNKLLDPTSSYYRENVVGLKTGSTDEAGYCLLTLERRGDRLIIVGVFGCTAATGRFEDTVAILESLA